MVYLTVDAATGEIVAASAGHPAPLLVSAEGEVTQLNVRGLALGVDSGQEYDEIRAHVEAGGAIVLYTDGVIEARLKGELYGPERLDAGRFGVVHARRHGDRGGGHRRLPLVRRRARRRLRRRGDQEDRVVRRLRDLAASETVAIINDVSAGLPRHLTHCLDDT